MASDLNNLQQQLQAELRRMRYGSQLDIGGSRQGLPEAFLPLIHFGLLSYSRNIARWLAANGHELFGKSDLRFVEGSYRVLRDEFAYNPRLTREQFFSTGFAGQKMILVRDLLRLCARKHTDLKKSGSSSRGGMGGGGGGGGSLRRGMLQSDTARVEIGPRALQEALDSPGRPPHPHDSLRYDPALEREMHPRTAPSPTRGDGAAVAALASVGGAGAGAGAPHLDLSLSQSLSASVQSPGRRRHYQHLYNAPAATALATATGPVAYVTSHATAAAATSTTVTGGSNSSSSSSSVEQHAYTRGLASAARSNYPNPGGVSRAAATGSRSALLGTTTAPPYNPREYEAGAYGVRKMGSHGSQNYINNAGDRNRSGINAISAVSQGLRLDDLQSPITTSTAATATSAAVAATATAIARARAVDGYESYALDNEEEWEAALIGGAEPEENGIATVYASNLGEDIMPLPEDEEEVSLDAAVTGPGPARRAATTQWASYSMQPAPGRGISPPTPTPPLPPSSSKAATNGDTTGTGSDILSPPKSNASNRSAVAEVPVQFRAFLHNSVDAATAASAAAAAAGEKEKEEETINGSSTEMRRGGEADAAAAAAAAANVTDSGAGTFSTELQSSAPPLESAARAVAAQAAAAPTISSSDQSPATVEALRDIALALGNLQSAFEATNRNVSRLEEKVDGLTHSLSARVVLLESQVQFMQADQSQSRVRDLSVSAAQQQLQATMTGMTSASSSSTTTTATTMATTTATTKVPTTPSAAANMGNNNDSLDALTAAVQSRSLSTPPPPIVVSAQEVQTPPCDSPPRHFHPPSTSSPRNRAPRQARTQLVQGAGGAVPFEPL